MTPEPSVKYREIKHSNFYPWFEDVHPTFDSQAATLLMEREKVAIESLRVQA